MENKKIGYGIWAIAIIITLLFMSIMGNIIKPDKHKSPPPPTINGVSLIGLDRITAVDKLAQTFVDTKEQFELTLTSSDKSWTIKGSDFHINSDIYSIIDEAQRRQLKSYDYNSTKDYFNQNSQNDFYVNINYLFIGFDDKINEIINEVSIPATDSSITFDSNHKPTIIEDKNGIAVDKDLLYTQINNKYVNQQKFSLEIPLVPTCAKIKKEDNMKSLNLLSSFSTSVHDSTGNRKYNVKLALQFLDTLRIAPHQQVSFNSITGPHTKETGYKNATIIYEGKFQDGIGGGICQASSTLYNALLLAGKQIDQAKKHTLPVKYVPLSLDAMVSEGISDLVFTNNSDYAMFIHTYSDEKSVTVKIFGEQMPDGVVYKTRSETIRKILPQDKTMIDTNKEYTNKVLYQGEKYRIKYPKNGYETKAYLEKYENDKLVSSTLIRHDIYKAQDGLVVEGACPIPKEFTTADYQILDGNV